MRLAWSLASGPVELKQRGYGLVQTNKRGEGEVDGYNRAKLMVDRVNIKEEKEVHNADRQDDNVRSRARTSCFSLFNSRIVYLVLLVFVSELDFFLLFIVLCWSGIVVSRCNNAKVIKTCFIIENNVMEYCFDWGSLGNLFGDNLLYTTRRTFSIYF